MLAPSHCRLCCRSGLVLPLASKAYSRLALAYVIGQINEEKTQRRASFTKRRQTEKAISTVNGCLVADKLSFIFSSLSAPTKIEELKAGVDEKHNAAPPGIEPRVLRILVARSNNWATKPQPELRVNGELWDWQRMLPLWTNLHSSTCVERLQSFALARKVSLAT